ncbi:MAG: hypothetical protein MJH10_00460 [Epibacterium sp.]|nr:hypothetical protein [Epibacterium sp.]NQX72039.1 hypothetical protein [Epibacterium sp.]
MVDLGKTPSPSRAPGRHASGVGQVAEKWDQPARSSGKIIYWPLVLLNGHQANDGLADILPKRAKIMHKILFNFRTFINH